MIVLRVRVLISPETSSEARTAWLINPRAIGEEMHCHRGHQVEVSRALWVASPVERGGLAFWAAGFLVGWLVGFRFLRGVSQAGPGRTLFGDL